MGSIPLVFSSKGSVSYSVSIDLNYKCCGFMDGNASCVFFVVNVMILVKHFQV